MKKSTITLIVVIALVVAVIAGVVGSYNGFVEKQAAVENAQSNTATQLQRRADLIPNFVSTVKGYSDYEQKTYTAVTEARTAAKTATTVGEQQKAGQELNSAIDVWVNAVTEAYPDLKANQQYLALQDELAGTENRIATARRDYNAAAKAYNVAIRRFPGKILASVFGFDKVDYFEAAEGTDQVPQVSFESQS